MSDGTTPGSEPRLLAAVGQPLQAGRRLRAPLSSARPAQAGVLTRAVFPDDITPDFQLAVKLVTGQDVNLRGPARPQGGWVATGVPRGSGGWGYAAGGTLYFSVSKNDQAATDWRNAAWVYEDVDHEVFSGRFGLMDVQRLRDAEQLTNHRIDVVNAALGEIKRVTDKMDNGNLAGGAATVLAAKLRELSQYIAVQRDILTEPPPTVPKVLHAAAEALAECGRALSYVWWESNQVLLGAPDCEIDAVRNNGQQLPQHERPRRNVRHPGADGSARGRTRLPGVRGRRAGIGSSGRHDPAGAGPLRLHRGRGTSGGNGPDRR